MFGFLGQLFVTFRAACAGIWLWWQATKMIVARQVLRPTYFIRLHRKQICEETLVHYDVPYSVDRTDETFLLLHCEMDMQYARMLLKHTRQTLDRKRFIESRTRSTPPSPHVEGDWSDAAHDERNRRCASADARVRHLTSSSESSTPAMEDSSHHHSHRSRSRSLTPTYPKVHRDYVHEKSLRYFEIPYRWDPNEPAFFVLLQEMTQEELEALFEHTYQLRAKKEHSINPSPLPLTRIDSPFHDEFAGVDAAGERLLALRKTLEERIEPAVVCFLAMPPLNRDQAMHSRQWLEDLVLESVMKPANMVETESGAECDYLKKDLLYDCTKILCELDAHL